ncbi:hypothetical protein BS50DRAFT_494426 [Corynespora cassiicola Philippines]|uniref:Peptidase C14 caspase domain-containing protein n=1 Tax=Corynespora cassiicola Philippines TaxID=1448308 RepID=A0A2T2NPX4_CORCC|nr:hypothetical protein BS50DRAFT_494426 [Corynespora cassiicola Philippines]
MEQSLHPLERNHSPIPRLGIKTALPLSPLSASDDEVQRLSGEDQHETELQEHWDQSIAKHMNIPEGYDDVQVLMIKWHDDIDQLCVRQEVNSLTRVFKEELHYEVEEVNLKAVNTQLQLQSAVTTWAFNKDTPHSLLIVYYAGHAVYDIETKLLKFSPTNEGDGLEVIWNQAEKPFLETVKADVLAIMDCCFASDLLRNVPEYGRTFEMLAASHMGETTASPGKDSFTASLITHLRDLAAEYADGYFTTRDIEERMKRERGIEGPALWRRIPGSSRHIRLSKMKPREERTKEFVPHRQFIHLGFALRYDSLSKDQIERLTKELPALFRKENIPLVDIKWLGCRKVGHPSFRQVAKWVLHNGKEIPAISPIQSRKRSSEAANLDEVVAEMVENSVSHKALRRH